MAGSLSGFAAADDSPITGVRTTVPLSEKEKCTTATITIKDLAKHYYGRSSLEFVNHLKERLKACKALPGNEGYLAVIFAGKLTDKAKDPSIVHVLLRLDRSTKKEDDRVVREVGGLPGVDTLSWAVLSDSEDEPPKIVLHSTVIENPLISQIGPLVAKVLGAAAFQALSAAGAKRGSATVLCERPR